MEVVESKAVEAVASLRGLGRGRARLLRNVEPGGEVAGTAAVAVVAVGKGMEGEVDTARLGWKARGRGESEVERRVVAALVVLGRRSVVEEGLGCRQGIGGGLQLAVCTCTRLSSEPETSLVMEEGCVQGATEAALEERRQAAEGKGSQLGKLLWRVVDCGPEIEQLEMLAEENERPEHEQLATGRTEGRIPVADAQVWKGTQLGNMLLVTGYEMGQPEEELAVRRETATACGQPDMKMPVVVGCLKAESK